MQKRQTIPIAYFARFYLLPEPPIVGRRSFYNLRLTYEASHPIACDGCEHARTVAGGESLLSAVVAASGNYPDCSELVYVARPLPAKAESWRTLRPGSSVSRSYREVVIRWSFMKLSNARSGLLHAGTAFWKNKNRTSRPSGCQILWLSMSGYGHWEEY